jgi:hypothetical protein
MEVATAGVENKFPLRMAKTAGPKQMGKKAAAGLSQRRLLFGSH